jgi:hypothetical protein
VGPRAHLECVVRDGRAGRVAATAALLAPLWVLVAGANPFYIMALMIWCTTLLPRALRDVWTRTRLVHRPPEKQ